MQLSAERIAFIQSAEQQLSELGFRLTTRRRRILESLLDSAEYATMPMLFDAARAKDPNTSFGAVYRLVRLLVDRRLVQEHRFAGKHTRFRFLTTRASDYHLVCFACGSVLGCEEPELRERQERLARGYGFTFISHTRVLYGRCAACQEKGRSNPEVTGS